jgi:vancomycin permeability regulator SanA
MQHDLIERGVPLEKIVAFTHDADNTIDEAKAVVKLAGQHRWKSLVIVTSNYHTRRTRYIYGKLLPAGITVSVASARDGDFDPQRWWEKRKSVKLFVREFAGMSEAMWELRGEPKASGSEADAVEKKDLGSRKNYAQKGHIRCGKVLTCALHLLSALIS